MLKKSLIFILIHLSLCEENFSKNSDLCQELQQQFEQNIYDRSHYLTNYLEILKKLNCSNFQNQCESRLYSITPFAELIYDQICDRDVLIEKCFQTVKNSVKSNKSTWNTLLPDLIDLPQLDLKDPCIQVALYDNIIIKKGYSFGEFEEVKEFLLPFCEPIFCGVDKYHRENFSAIFFASKSCSISQTILKIFYGVSIFAIAFPNLLVIVAILTSTKLKTVQGIYRINLAVIDFLSGIIIFSTSIWILSRYAFAKLQFEDQNDDLAENFFDKNFTNISVSTLLSRGTKFPLRQDFMDFSGFLFVFFQFNSIYTLLIASFDRLVAVSKPLKYHKWLNIKSSMLLCVLAWITSSLLSAVPMLRYDVKYKILHGSFIAFDGEKDHMILFLNLFFPLCIMWLLNIVTFIKIKQHGKKMKNLNAIKRTAVEKKAGKTLAIMVAAFSFSITPLCIFAAIADSLSMINIHDMENFDVKTATNLKNAVFLSNLLLLYNSFWNFFIYQFRDELFRKRIKEIFNAVSNSLPNFTVNYAS